MKTAALGRTSSGSKRKRAELSSSKRRRRSVARHVQFDLDVREVEDDRELNNVSTEEAAHARSHSRRNAWQLSNVVGIDDGEDYEEEEEENRRIQLDKNGFENAQAYWGEVTREITAPPRPSPVPTTPLADLDILQSSPESEVQQPKRLKFSEEDEVVSGADDGHSLGYSSADSSEKSADEKDKDDSESDSDSSSSSDSDSDSDTDSSKSDESASESERGERPG